MFLSILPKRTSPLITTTLQAICINILANIIAQYIEFRKIQAALLTATQSASDLALEHLALSGEGETITAVNALMNGGGSKGGVGMGFGLDWARVVQFVVWTCITVPLNFRWQGWLEKRFPAYYESVGGGGGGDGLGKEKVEGVVLKGGEEVLPFAEGDVTTRSKKRNVKHTFLKILCGCAAPVNCAMFLSVMTLLKGGSVYDAVQTVRVKFWPLKFAGWRIWPLVGLVNFTFVPVERRVIVSTIIGLCWNVFLVLFIS